MNFEEILDDKKLRYPQGAGGSWFLNLLAILVDYSAYNKHDYNNSINFHSPLDDTVNTHEINNNKDIILSDNCGFNFYLNFWWKKRVYENYNNFNMCNDYEKIQILSDEARWILYSDDYKTAYLDTISIKWQWLWYDIEKFIQSIESIIKQELNQSQIKIVHQHVELYKHTNVRPTFHFHNYTSIPWLAWGLAILIEKNIELDFEFVDSKQIPLLSKQLVSHDVLLAKETMHRMLLI